MNVWVLVIVHGSVYVCVCVWVSKVKNEMKVNRTEEATPNNNNNNNNKGQLNTAAYKQ